MLNLLKNKLQYNSHLLLNAQNKNLIMLTLQLSFVFLLTITNNYIFCMESNENVYSSDNSSSPLEEDETKTEETLQETKSEGDDYVYSDHTPSPTSSQKSLINEMEEDHDMRCMEDEICSTDFENARLMKPEQFDAQTIVSLDTIKLTEKDGRHYFVSGSPTEQKEAYLKKFNESLETGYNQQKEIAELKQTKNIQEAIIRSLKSELERVESKLERVEEGHKAAIRVLNDTLPRTNILENDSTAITAESETENSQYSESTSDTEYSESSSSFVSNNENENITNRHQFSDDYDSDREHHVDR